MQEKLKKYARLLVEVGVNVQEGQIVFINAPVDCACFARDIVEAAYQAKAKNVVVRWNDELVNKSYFMNVDEDVLTEVPEYSIKQFEYIVEKGACVINISSPNPGLLKDVDPKKMQISTKAMNEKVGFYRKHMMSNGAQWTIGAYPNLAWAKKVFPDMDDALAQEQLLDAILEASRVRHDNDPVSEWKEHMTRLANHNEQLNTYRFKTLHFKNGLGTDLTIGLVDDHIWAGGGEEAQNGVFFAPNIPTEETFTMPHREKINGKVVATKPLNYQGKLIQDFYFVFKDGKVVEYGAREEQDNLKSLIELDEGSSSLGEVALISHDSPISNTNILFYNTLFDENASCHLALGNAYTMNIKDGYSMNEEELKAKGYNKSIAHVDFMFGSADMEIVGETHDGQQIQVFKNGNFVF